MLLLSLSLEVFVTYNLLHPLFNTLCSVLNVTDTSFFVSFTLNLSLFSYFTCVSYRLYVVGYFDPIQEPLSLNREL